MRTLAAGLVLAGCAAAAPTATTAVAPAPAASTAAPRTAAAPSCHRAASVGRSRHTLAVGGVTRTYLLDVPARPDPGHARAALVIDLHGYGQSAAQQDAYTGLGAAGRAAGVIVATPDGVRGQWNFVRRAAVGPDDVAFLGALVGALERQACADPARVVLTGISDGADIADVAGCGLAGIAAVVGVAPSVPVVPCAHRVPTLVEVHGTGDPIVPYGGGGGDRPPPFQGTEAVAVATRLADWAAARGCGRAPAPHAVTASITASVWSCRSGRLALYSVAGGGHTWPGAAPWPALGATTTERSATSAVLAVARRPSRLPW